MKLTLKTIRQSGYTLIEILLAVSVLGIMTLMVTGSINSLSLATTTAEKTLDQLHLNTNLMDKLATSLRAAVFDSTEALKYEFRHEDGRGEFDRDIISWVTDEPLFISPSSTTRGAPHRIQIQVQELKGRETLTVQTASGILSQEDYELAVKVGDARILCSHVKGLNIWFYDVMEERWTENWEKKGQLPISLILEVTIENEGNLFNRETLRRRVDIPVANLSRHLRRNLK